LTWNASSQEVDAFAQAAKIEPPDVPFMQWPFVQWFDVASLILTDRRTCIGVPLNYGFVLEASVGHAKGKATYSCE